MASIIVHDHGARAMFRAWTRSQARNGALPAPWRDSHGRRQMPC